VVIVGAGVAGLAAAWRLRRAGLDDIVVLELDPVAGGTARAGQSPLGAFPWGAHYITAPMKEHRSLITLLDEMGIVEARDADGAPVFAEAVLCRDPQERVFYDGRWHAGLFAHEGATERDESDLDRFRREIERWVAWRDTRGRRAFAIPTSQGSDDAEVTALDRISMAAWLDAQGLRSPRLRWVIAYACRDDYGASLEHTSAWAGLFYYASRMRAPGDDPQAVITWPEGNGRLVDHLSRSLGARLYTDATVLDVSPATTSRGVAVTALTSEGNTWQLDADAAIVAAPRFVASRIVGPWRQRRPAHAEAFEYGAWMVAHLTLTRRPRNKGFGPAWDNVIYDSPSLGYVSNLHQHLIDHGRTHWTYYYPLCDNDAHTARRRLLDTGRDAWADIAMTDLERAHPEIRHITERLDVMRWGHAMVRPKPGFRWSTARRDAAIPLGRIHFAHSDLSGVALFEEAWDHGLRAAEEVLAERMPGSAGAVSLR
jgi:hypothetical protein